jgi:DNA-binding response OmpR family regulator
VARSRGDAHNQGEFLRVLIERSRDSVARNPERAPLVLVVEDDPDNLCAYEEMLRLDGFRTVSAATVRDAVRVAEAVQPAAAVLDHLLPDGPGTALCVELRRHGDGTLPIVMVTGVDPRTVEMDGGDGPDAVMGKPCRPDLLTALLKLLVRHGKPASDARDDEF